MIVMADAPGITLWLPLLLAIPIGIVAGIAANIITPRAQNWLATRSLSQASKRINVLKTELETVSNFHSNMNKLYLKSANVIFNILFFLVLGSILSLLSSIVSFLGYYAGRALGYSGFYSEFVTTAVTALLIGISIVPYLLAAVAALNHVRLISRVDNIEKYTKAVNAQIKHIEAKMPKQPGLEQ